MKAIVILQSAQYIPRVVLFIMLFIVVQNVKSEEVTTLMSTESLKGFILTRCFQFHF